MNTPNLPAIAGPVRDRGRHARGMTLIQRRIWWSAGAGLVPIPLAEVVAITAIQIRLIKDLADLYQLDFDQERAKSVVITLLGGLGSVSLGKITALGLLRFLPGIGIPAASVSVSAFATGVTYAIGIVFLTHFEQGGTLGDLDPDQAKALFKASLKTGMRLSGDAGKDPSGA